MFPALRPLMNSRVRHLHEPARDLFGNRVDGVSDVAASYERHPAKVTRMGGSVNGPASGERTGDAAAVIWLLNHPRSIAIGDVFELSNGDLLSVIRFENRTSGSATVSKVYLS